ncbi:MAG: hypothetical protein ACTSR4_05775, partial [Candidatus Hodarchaeales archaeon]
VGGETEVTVFLDSVWVEAVYGQEATGNQEQEADKTIEVSTEKLLKVKIKNNSLIFVDLGKKDFRYDEEPTFIIIEPSMSVQELIDTGMAEKLSEEALEEETIEQEPATEEVIIDEGILITEEAISTTETATTSEDASLEVLIEEEVIVPELLTEETSTTTSEINSTSTSPNEKGISKEDPVLEIEATSTEMTNQDSTSIDKTEIIIEEIIENSIESTSSESIESIFDEQGQGILEEILTFLNRLKEFFKEGIEQLKSFAFNIKNYIKEIVYRIIPRTTAQTIKNKKNNIKVKIFDPEGKESSLVPKIVTQLVDGKERFEVKLPKPKTGFKPGVWKMKVELETAEAIFVAEQDFTWGVLAININKSIYLPEEEAYLQMAALRDDGHTLCDASLELKITAPNGSTIYPQIQKSGECSGNNITDVPDYFTYYQTEEAGIYQMKLKNLGNGYEITDFFEVRNSVPFDIERIGPTRIYPPADYKMKLNILTNQDFEGQIIETVPAGFDIQSSTSSFTFQISRGNNPEEKNIIWDLNLKEGEQIELNYTFNAPNISPYLYFLGPLTFKEFQVLNFKFQEIRQWQIAADQTLIIRPDGVGTDGLDTVSGAATHWEAVNEDPSEGDDNYVANTTKNTTQYDLYSLADHTTEIGGIDSITVYINARQAAKTGSTAATVIKIGGTEYRGTANALGETYAPASTVYTENPFTSAVWTWSDIDSLQAGVELVNPNTQGVQSFCTQSWVLIDYTGLATLNQRSYRWQNDDGNNVTSTSNIAAADTGITMEKGERAILRIQIDNTGGLSTTTDYKLQFKTLGAGCGAAEAWLDATSTAAISYSLGLSAANGDPVNATVTDTTSSCGDGSCTGFISGTWHEAAATTSSHVLNADYNTEFGFMIETSNAATNTTYCLRLYNNEANKELDNYSSYGQLTIVSDDTKRYSKEPSSSSLSSGYSDLTYYLDSAGYTSVATDD